MPADTIISPMIGPAASCNGISACGPPKTGIGKPGDLPSAADLRPHHTDSGSRTRTRRCICKRRSTTPLAVNVLPRPFFPRMAMSASTRGVRDGVRFQPGGLMGKSSLVGSHNFYIINDMIGINIKNDIEGQF